MVRKTLLVITKMRSYSLLNLSSKQVRDYKTPPVLTLPQRTHKAERWNTAMNYKKIVLLTL